MSDKDTDRIWKDAIDEITDREERFDDFADGMYRIIEDAKSLGLPRLAGMVMAITIAYKTGPAAVSSLAEYIQKWIREEGVREVLRKASNNSKEFEDDES